MRGPLQRLLAPRSIAVVGGAPAERVVKACLGLGFPGSIWPVNPRRSDLGGVPTVPSLADLPGVPDAVFLGVNRVATVAAMGELAPLGVGGVVCYGSGFAESGAGDLQADLLAAAGDVPFFGPNCYGYVNTFDRVALWPDEHGLGRHERGVAIVSQSGNVACNLTFAQRHARLGGMVTVGNQASLGMEDCIDAFLDDERITAIGLFLEAVRDPQRFATAAMRAAAQGVPIVALQTGRTAAGAAIAASHTGSMAGRAAAYDALFERYGVLTVRTPAELLETLKLLDHGGRLSGPRLVSLSCSGGEASLIADRAEGTGLRFEPFTPEHQAAIEATVTEHVSVSNPFDYHTFMWGDLDATTRCFTAVMDGPQDATLLLLDAPTGPGQDNSAWFTSIDALAAAAAATGNRAVVVASMGENLHEPLCHHALSLGVTPLLGLSEALVALDLASAPSSASTVRASSAESPTGTTHAPVDAAGPVRLVDEAEAKGRLKAWGVAVPEGLVAPVDGVMAAADRIGFPVTVKALGLAHKSESGAVRVGLRSADELADALGAMPEAARYLVESTITDVVAELLVAVRRDPPVGWLVSVGFGGVLTEVWADVTHLLAPVTSHQVRAALARLRSAPLLTGFRGRPAADVDALADLVVRLVDSVIGTSVVEVELNPVLVKARGAGAVAVDALWVEER